MIVEPVVIVVVLLDPVESGVVFGNIASVVIAEKAGKAIVTIPREASVIVVMRQHLSGPIDCQKVMHREL